MRASVDPNGRIAPIKDPSLLSFDLTGSIQTIDFNSFQELAKRCGFEQGQISGTMTLYCQQGVFDPEKSVLHLTFNKVKLTKEQQAQFNGIPFPETFKALVPVKGRAEASISAVARRACGHRRPTLPVFAVTFSGIWREAGTTRVRGPGQNLFASVKKSCGGSWVRSAA